MASSRSQLLDLPDEILLSVFENINGIDVFQLKGLNKRIDNIVYDEVITSNLTLFKCLSHDVVRKLDNELMMLVCLQILPEIHHKIQSLNVELSSIESIFFTTIYPNLYKLGLYNIDEYAAFSLFQGKKFDI